jgi:hypothetical protein
MPAYVIEKNAYMRKESQQWGSMACFLLFNSFYVKKQNQGKESKIKLFNNFFVLITY